MSKTFYVGFFVAVAFAAMVLLSTSAMGQIWIDEIQVGVWNANYGRYFHSNYASVGTATVYDRGGLYNYGKITNATVNDGGLLDNYNGGRIDNATVYNGGGFGNKGTITTATVNGGNLSNNYGGSIGTATVNGGSFSNNYGGSIGTATVNGGSFSNVGGITDTTVNGGTLENAYEGTINTLTVNNGGNLNNSYGGTINTLTVDGGWLYSYMGGRIDNATVNGGLLTNNYGSTITTATVNDGGYLHNYNYEGYGGGITNATLNGGTLENNNSMIYYASLNGGTLRNWNGGTITEATQNGGEINNSGRIAEMTYVAGTYNRTGTGTIGTLTLAGDAANNTGDWGIIENLVFDNGGNGLITFTASANTMAAAVEMAFDGIQPMNANLPGISFNNGITAANIDFTYGNIALDFSALAGFSENDILSSLFADGFWVASLFGNANVTGFDSLNSFALDFASGSLFVKSGGVYANGWSLADGFITWNGAEVPEPATLLMLGVTVAGLPVMRRLRKR